VDVLVGTDVSVAVPFLGGLAHDASVHHELLKELDGTPVLALIKDRSLERQFEAIGLGAAEVLLTGSVEKIAATVERLIGH
jgi:hypothetical protein